MSTRIQRNTRGAAAERRKKCYLLTLPNELRRDILMRAIPTGKIFRPKGNIIREPEPVGTFLALTQTCRQMYTEGLDIYYSQNTFTFTTVNAMRTFLEEVSEDRRKFIKCISFELVGKLKDLVRAAELLYQCMGLKSLEVQLSNSYGSIFLYPGHLARYSKAGWALKGLRGLERVTILPIQLRLSCGIRHLDEQSERNDAVRAQRIEEILKQHVCRTRAEGDQFSSEKLAEVQAQKARERQELMNRNAEWQKRKIVRD